MNRRWRSQCDVLMACGGGGGVPPPLGKDLGSFSLCPLMSLPRIPLLGVVLTILWCDLTQAVTGLSTGCGISASIFVVFVLFCFFLLIGSHCPYCFVKLQFYFTLIAAI